MWLAPRKNQCRPNLESRTAALVVAAAALLTAGTAAHHGAADYNVDREITVTGLVKEWRWTNPHTWVYLTVRRPDGTTEEWDGEGPPLTWASGQGWSSTTLKPGEEVSLVLYPSRRSARGGLVKRIERRAGEVLVVSRPWLDAR